MIDRKTVLQIAREADISWGDSYDVLWPVLKRKKCHVGAEIGVAFGGHAERILSNTKVTLYGVDPYQHFNDYDDPMNVSQSEFDCIYAYTMKRLRPYKKRFHLLRHLSGKAVDMIKSPIDFVYIDGDHSYEGVKQDIELWGSKVAWGGIVSGHDFNHPNFPGVKRAVEAYSKKYNWVVHTHKSGVWWLEKTKPNISYIIPAYNCADTLAESIASIYKGNFVDGDETIIVDDHSTDATRVVMRSLAKKYDNIKCLFHKSNRGGGATRNTAVRATKHPYIFCLDSDNLLQPHTVRPLLELLMESGADVAAFEKIQYFKDKREFSHEWLYQYRIYDKTNYLKTNIVPGASGNYIFTKSSWINAGGYPEDAHALDTWGFGLRQVMSGSQMVILKNSQYLHRIGKESYWIRESKKANVSQRVYRLLIPYLSELNQKDLAFIRKSENSNNWFEHLEKNPIRYQKKLQINIMLQKSMKSLKKLVWRA